MMIPSPLKHPFATNQLICCPELEPVTQNFIYCNKSPSKNERSEHSPETGYKFREPTSIKPYAHERITSILFETSWAIIVIVSRSGEWGGGCVFGVGSICENGNMRPQRANRNV